MLAASNDYNFDHPDAFDFGLLVHTLRKLKLGKSVKIPVYDFTTHGRQKEWVSASVLKLSSVSTDQMLVSRFLPVLCIKFMNM